MRGSSPLLLAAALAACHGTEPGSAGLLRGSFATPVQNRAGYFALSLQTRDGVVTGRGWATSSPSLLGGATVTGTYSPPNVDLQIHPRLSLTDWSFRGVFEGDTLKGKWGFGGLLIESVELARTDTIPLGDYSLSVSGAIRDSAIGSAWFGYTGSSFQLFQSFQLQAAAASLMRVFWRRRDMPPPGTYQLSGEGGPGPSVEFLYGEPELPQLRYALQSGTLTVSLSSRYALGGSVTFTATSPAGAVLNVKGKFSSGCWSSSC